MIARETRAAVVELGGQYLYGPECRVIEDEGGMPRGGYYFRGRAAVLGSPPAAVVASLFGIFPTWVIDLVLAPPIGEIPAEEAIDFYLAAVWQWAGTNLPFAGERAADLISRVVDNADDFALPLFAGWRRVERPASGPERLGHVLMVLRELRGGLHFAALRTFGVGILEAVGIDPLHGRPHLLRIGWQPHEADAIMARITPELTQRWHRAEQMTDSALEQAFNVLSAAEKIELRDLLLTALSKFGQVTP